MCLNSYLSKSIWVIIAEWCVKILRNYTFLGQQSLQVRLNESYHQHGTQWRDTKKKKKNNEKRQKHWKWEEWNSLWWVRYKSRMKIINTVKYQSMHSAREFGLSWVLHTWPKTSTYSRLSGVPDCPGPTMSVYSRGTAGTCCADGTHACGAPVSQLLPSPTSYSLSLTCPWFWFCSASNWPHQGATQNTCILSSPLSYMTPMKFSFRTKAEQSSSLL